MQGSREMRNKLDFLSISRAGSRRARFPDVRASRDAWRSQGIHWIADAPYTHGMTDRIGNVMVYKSSKIGDGFLLLLARADGSNTAQTALKKRFTLCSCIPPKTLR